MKNTLELKQVVAELRDELLQIAVQGAGKDMRFKINNIELELHTVVEKQGKIKGKGKMKFLVLDVDAELEGSLKHVKMQKIKLSLQPVKVDEKDKEAVSGGDFLLSDD